MNINQYVAQAKANHTPIIDVRPDFLYNKGHIPGAINIPITEIKTAAVQPGSYLYCISGYHASLAAQELEQRGIPATDIGGIENYTGDLES